MSKYDYVRNEFNSPHVLKAKKAMEKAEQDVLYDTRVLTDAINKAYWDTSRKYKVDLDIKNNYEHRKEFVNAYKRNYVETIFKDTTGMEYIKDKSDDDIKSLYDGVITPLAEQQLATQRFSRETSLEEMFKENGYHQVMFEQPIISRVQQSALHSRYNIELNSIINEENKHHFLDIMKSNEDFKYNNIIEINDVINAFYKFHFTRHNKEDHSYLENLGVQKSVYEEIKKYNQSKGTSKINDKNSKYNKKNKDKKKIKKKQNYKDYKSYNIEDKINESIYKEKLSDENPWNNTTIKLKKTKMSKLEIREIIKKMESELKKKNGKDKKEEFEIE